jgi:hypothetical protein
MRPRAAFASRRLLLVVALLLCGIALSCVSSSSDAPLCKAGLPFSATAWKGRLAAARERGGALALVRRQSPALPIGEPRVRWQVRRQGVGARCMWQQHGYWRLQPLDE